MSERAEACVPRAYAILTGKTYAESCERIKQAFNIDVKAGEEIRLDHVEALLENDLGVSEVVKYPAYKKGRAPLLPNWVTANSVGIFCLAIASEEDNAINNTHIVVVQNGKVRDNWSDHDPLPPGKTINNSYPYDKSVVAYVYKIPAY